MRQFILDGQKIHNGLVTIDGKDFRYLRQVLRVKSGDMISLRLENGYLQNGTVVRVDDKARKVMVQLCAQSGFSAAYTGSVEAGVGTGVGAGASGSGDETGVGECSAVGTETEAAGGARSGGCGTPGDNVRSKASITRGVQAFELERGFGLGGAVGAAGTEAAAPEFYLMQFITKPQKFEQIVRQATECGVRKIIPVKGEYSEKSSILALENSKKERLGRIIREARQQSGSPVPTELCEPLSLENAVALWKADSDEAGAAEDGACPGFVLYERNENTESLAQVVASAGRGKVRRVCVCVGCEGGISPSEIEFLCKKGLFHPIHFAVNILRAETAALYGMAAVQSFILSE